MAGSSPDEAGGGASRTTDIAAGSSAATDVSLREYLTLALRRLEDLFNAHRISQEEATRIALTSVDKRFDGVNEFRGALNDLSSRMATKDQLEGLGEKLDTSHAALESRFQALYQRNRDDIDAINTRLNLREGEDQGARLTKGSIYTIVGVGVAVIGLLVVLANYFTTH